MSSPNVVKAQIVLQRNGQDIDTVEVHFNPVSLQVEITNSTSPQSGSGNTTQTATQSSAKLGLDLLFDTTHTGEDVRSITRRLRAAVRAPGGSGGGGIGRALAAAAAAFTPPTLRFEWGTFTFTGIADTFRETLDFFSPEGVPLRSQVALALKEQPNEFSALERDNPAAASASRARSSAFEVPGGLGGAAGIAGLGGDLRAARAIAGMNGEASLRFSAGATLAVGASVALKGAVSFAGGASIGAGMGVGAGVGVGGGIGIGASLGAGIAASAAAPTLRFDAGRLAAPPAARQLATDAGAGFTIDGRALPAGAAGLRANVGQAGRLRFDD